MRPASALSRPAATLTAALLLAGLVQTGPAAAAPSGTDGLAVAISLAPERLEAGPYPGPGSSPDHPADFGRIPGSWGIRALVTNTGSEPLHDIAVATRVVANGVVSEPHCDHVPWIPPDEPQPEPVDDLVLDPGQSVLCRYQVSAVMDGVVHEDVASVTVRGVASDATASGEAHLYATAEDDSVKVGDRVWLDTDRDGVQDVGEPGIEGVRLSLTGPDGRPATDVYSGGEVGPRTTDADGHYLFTHLLPLPYGDRYTVTVDPGSPALEDLLPTLAGVGSSLTDSSTGAGQSAEWLDSTGTQDPSVDFGYVTPEAPPVTPPGPGKAAVALTADASPEPAVKGSKITVKGSIRRDDQGYKARTVLEFRSDGSDAYVKVKTVRSSSKGALSASVTASGSGTFRYRFAGSTTTEAGASEGDHVEVVKASVRLTADASPETVTKGKKVTVKGSLRRDGRKYRATTVLEFRGDGSDAYAKVKSVRSSRKGTLSAKVTTSRSGTFRYRFAGNSTTQAGVSDGDHVVVKPKPPSKPKPKTYKNCTELTKVYPHGVGRSGAKDKGGDVTDFTRDTRTYDKNTKSDRDKDGIACER